ncbi:MAG: hypothetical protein ACOZNI_24865 [Myxococcota bacterium]
MAVRLLDGEEARVRAHADALGVDEPVGGGALRQHEGACVFLDADARCRLHAAFGADAKPRVCAQYPVVAVRTETGLRVGVDPGCYTGLRTWRDGPAIAGGAVHALQDARAPGVAAVELRLAAACAARGQTLGGLVGALVGEDPDGGFPPRFAARWRARLREVDVGRLIAEPAAGVSLRASLAGVAALSAREDWPSPAPLSPEAEAWALEVVERMVWLRLCRTLPDPMPVALLVAAGAWTCAVADARPEAFGPALAGWTRALRAPAFRAALVPDAATMGRLAVG